MLSVGQLGENIVVVMSRPSKNSKLGKPEKLYVITPFDGCMQCDIVQRSEASEYNSTKTRCG